MALIFDSLTTARMLESKGFSPEQAEGIAEQMNQLLVQDIATKGDIALLQAATQSDIALVHGEMASLRNELKGHIGAVRTELKGDIAVVRGDIKAVRTEMALLASDLTVKIYTVGFAVVAFVVAAQKLLA